MNELSHIFKAVEGAQVIDVTPDIARQLIESANYDNRKVKPSVVHKYAKMMRSGEWVFSPETISVSRTGRLLNGQHRMLAVIESDVTCRFLFATGFDDEVFKVLDRGAVRTRADALGINKKTAECGAVIVALSGLRSGDTTDFDVAKASNLIEDVHQELIDFCNTASRVTASAPLRLGCVANVMAGADKHLTFGLYRDMVLGHTDKLPPVGHAMIKAILTGKMKSGGGALQRVNACVGWDVFNPASRWKTKINIKFKDDVAKKILEATGYEHA